MPEIGDSTVWKQTDADNTTGTQPSWSGSASPDTIDNAGRAMMGAITREWNWRNFTVSTTGSSNAFVVTYAVAPASLINGQRFGFVTNHAVTGAATLNINSLGAKAIMKDVGGTLTALASGDAPSGVFMEVAYRSGVDQFVWINRGQIPSSYYSPSGTDVALADGGTGASLTDPNADRILFWDDSAGAVTWLTAGTGLAISTTTMAVDINGLSEDTTPDESADYVMTYDASAGTLKKVLPSNLEIGGGVTLLGTITTTSGQSQSLGSLNLTSYKFLKLVLNQVSHNGGTSQGLMIGQSTSDDVLFTTASTISASDTVTGSFEIELATGVIAFSSMSSVTEVFVTTPVVNASTTISIALNQNGGAASFDAGSIKVYGIK
jgi:hypothetical protein